MLFVACGVHPILVDVATGTPLANEAIKFFPEWTENDVSRPINSL